MKARSSLVRRRCYSRPSAKRPLRSAQSVARPWAPRRRQHIFAKATHAEESTTTGATIRVTRCELVARRMGLLNFCSQILCGTTRGETTDACQTVVELQPELGRAQSCAIGDECSDTRLMKTTPMAIPPCDHTRKIASTPALACARCVSCKEQYVSRSGSRSDHATSRRCACAHSPTGCPEKDRLLLS